MRAGTLDKRVQLQLGVDTQDDGANGTGELIRSWTTLATVSARIKPLKGREFFTGGLPIAEMDTEITIRWAEALLRLSAKDRVLHTVRGYTTAYNIVSPPVEEDLGHRSLILYCKSGVHEG